MAEEETKEDITPKMESSSDKAVISPSTPQASENPPSPCTDSSGKQPVNTAPKEKIRKTRSLNSSSSVVKRVKVENEEDDETLSEKPASSSEENSLESQDSVKPVDKESEGNACLKDTVKKTSAPESKSPATGSSSAPQSDSVKEKPKQELNEEKAKLIKQIQEKEELLRRLKMVKMYRSKSDLSELRMLIRKWRNCSQLLLYELQSALCDDKKLSITQLIDYYGLDEELLHYNRDDEEFTGI